MGMMYALSGFIIHGEIRQGVVKYGLQAFMSSSYLNVPFSKVAIEGTASNSTDRVDKWSPEKLWRCPISIHSADVVLPSFQHG